MYRGRCGWMFVLLRGISATPPPLASLSQEVESGVNAAAAMFKPAEHPC